MVSLHIPDHVEREQRERSFLESGASPAGSPFDLGTPDGGSGEGGRDEAMVMV